MWGPTYREKTTKEGGVSRTRQGNVLKEVKDAEKDSKKKTSTHQTQKENLHCGKRKNRAI